MKQGQAVRVEPLKPPAQQVGGPLQHQKGRELHRGCDSGDTCYNRPMLWRFATGRSVPVDVPPVVQEVLYSPGRSLDAPMQLMAKKVLSFDFSHVRVHTDAKAARSARAVGAQAYTVGHDVVFGPNACRMATRQDLSLLMHELTHVMQQRGAAVGPQTKLEMGPSDSIFEREAERVADTLMRKTDPTNTTAAQVLTKPDVVPVERLVVHQAPHSLLQRRSIFQEFIGLFAGEEFDEATLHAYLRVLDETNNIQDYTDSDNKARAIVNAWIQGNSPYILTSRRIILLIKEMQSGFTGDADERAILELLERSENHHLQAIFGSNGVDVRSLNSDFHGPEWQRLQNFYERRFRGGMQALLQGQVNPRGRAVPLGTRLGEPSTRTPTHPGDRIEGAVCSIRDPGNCHSFEDWIEQFQGLPTFRAGSGHRVIGQAPAPQATATDPSADPSLRRPTLVSERARYWSTDRFIDGPTDAWVRANLPPHLVRTAYQLPSDCADIAIILRHVWLVAHRRTESYRGWLVGARLDQARSAEIRRLIRGPVISRYVSAIVRPYTGSGGEPIHSFESLQALLHEGDVLVWEHQNRRNQRTGGHTQTIMRITRNEAGHITEIGVLQGNQPIGPERARAIRRQEIERARREARREAEERGASEREIRRAERRAGRRAARVTPSIGALRAAPGRRIEVSLRRDAHLRDNEEGIWSFPTTEGRDVLVAAGPPAIRAVPAVRRGREGADVVRGLADWVPDLRRARDISALQSMVEAALLETRSLIEGGHVSIADQRAAQAFGHDFALTAGERLWHLARAAAAAANRRAPRRGNRRLRDRDLYAEDLAEESHYRPLRHINGLMQRLGAQSYVEDTRRLFSYLEPVFVRAARGITGIDFQRRRLRAGIEVANVLLTGFDPYMSARPFPNQPAGPGNEPRQVEPVWGRWNPSGAAVLQLDGRTFSADQGTAAAVEGVVFPVSFAEFRVGLVESVIGPTIDRLNAAITVSMDPNIEPTEAPIIERFAVGVHRLNNRRLEPIPPVPGTGAALGPAIIEARGDLPAISREAGLPQTRRVRGRAVPGSIRSGIRFRFVNAPEADRALRALSLPAQGQAEVVIDDPAALAIIVRTMERGVEGTGITFRVGSQGFQAWILEGPGGSFLSNEVSYRVLRAIAGASQRPVSFHIHTPRGEPIPQAVESEQERRSRYSAIQAGRGVVRRLVARLIDIIKAVARRVIVQRRRERSTESEQ